MEKMSSMWRSFTVRPLQMKLIASDVIILSKVSGMVCTEKFGLRLIKLFGSTVGLDTFIKSRGGRREANCGL